MAAKAKAEGVAMFSLTTSEKARELRVPEQQVRELANRGLLDHIRVGAGVRLFQPGTQPRGK